MSLTSDDMQRLQSYVRQNAEASALFEKLLLSYEMERHKICHEIRNPLTLLSSTIQLIESQHPEIRSFDYWNSLREDLDYMMELLQEFSLYNNSNDLRPETFSFRNFMERLVLSFAASCTASDIEFTSRLQENLPVITGDPVKLRQAILNLLKNARESIHGPGSVRLDVWSKWKTPAAALPKDRWKKFSHHLSQPNLPEQGLDFLLCKILSMPITEQSL